MANLTRQEGESKELELVKACIIEEGLSIRSTEFASMLVLEDSLESTWLPNL